jgi:hypothetical protein
MAADGHARLVPVGLLVLAFGLGGCPRRPPDFGPEPYEEAQAVLDAVRANQAAPGALIADARVRVATPAARGGADHFVVAERPGNLRLETLSFFGNPIALVLVSGDDFLLWEIEANRAWQGPATAESLGMLLPIDLEPDAVVSLLLGTPPLFQTRKAHLELDHARRRYVVSLLEAEVWQQVVVRPEDDVIEEVRWVTPAGEVLARLHYDRYQDVGRGRFPYEIRYETADGVSVRVLYRDVTFEPEPERLEGLFAVTLPEHVRVLPIEPGVPPPVILPEVQDEDADEDPEETLEVDRAVEPDEDLDVDRAVEPGEGLDEDGGER